MRIFKECEFKDKCPICGTKKKGDAILIPNIDRIKGNNAEAILVHIDCIDLVYSEDMNLLYQKLRVD